MEKAKENGGPRWVSQVIYEYLRAKRDLVDQGKIGAGTLHNYLDTVQAFCEANEDELGTAGGIINWKRISKGLPKRRSYRRR